MSLGGGKKKRKNPWDTNCHFPRPPLLSFSAKSVKLKMPHSFRLQAKTGWEFEGVGVPPLESHYSFSSPSPRLLSILFRRPRHLLPLGSHQSCSWERVQATQRGRPGAWAGVRTEGAERTRGAPCFSLFLVIKDTLDCL